MNFKIQNTLALQKVRKVVTILSKHNKVIPEIWLKDGIPISQSAILTSQYHNVHLGIFHPEMQTL